MTTIVGANCVQIFQVEYSTEKGAGYLVPIEAVSEDAALHKATIRHLATLDLPGNPNVELPKAYHRIRKGMSIYGKEEERKVQTRKTDD